MTGFAPGYFVFLAQSRPESTAEVISRVKANLEKIRTEGVPAEELDKIKAKLITAHAMKNTTSAERAFQAAVDEIYGLGYDHDETYPARISKVKPDDVRDVVKKYFEHAVIITTSPEASSEEAAAK